MVPVMAFAVITTVPSPAVMVLTISFPTWKMEFSIPVGTPIYSILRSKKKSGLKLILNASSLRESMETIRTQLMILENSVESAAPAAPMLKIYISMAFPMILMILATRDTFMDILEFPIALKSAAPAL